ncbi:MAG: AMIN domain-containing protein, partial [Desulfobacterales bacterium]
MPQKTYKGGISRVVSITTHQTNDQTSVTIVGDGNISEYISKSLKVPPRILVDIHCTARLLEAASINVDNPNIQSVRVGYHSDKIRIVIDVKGETVPAYTDKCKNNVLIITFESKKIADRKNPYHSPIKKEI